MEKQKQWIKPRHRVVVALLRPFLALYIRVKYGITADPFPQSESRPYLIIMNHQTGFDQFFVHLIFRHPEVTWFRVYSN